MTSTIVTTLEACHNPSQEMLSVAVFCRMHSISRALFYKLLQQGKAPRICKVGSRTLIAAEDAAAWRAGLAGGAR